MLAEIKRTFESLEAKHRDLLGELDSLPSETLNYKPKPGRWSIVEVVEHLVIAEDDLLNQLTGGASAADLDRSQRSHEKFLTVIKVMEKDVAVDVPDEKLEPRGQFTLEALLDRWDDIRQKMRAWIDGINSAKAGDLVYCHPFAGPLTMAETLRFVEVHFDNHMRHIEKIKARADKT